jgi:uncharacterized membrane protein
MKSWTLAALLFLCASAFAQTSEPASAALTARKSCDDLKAEISKKLEAKGVTAYTLDAVDKGKEGDAKVVGTCDGGTKSMTYTRGAAPAEAKSEDAKKQ